MRLSEVLGSRYVTDGDLNKMRTILETEHLVDIAGCMFSRKIAEKLSNAPNVTDSEDETIRSILEENTRLPDLLRNKPPAKLPPLFRPIQEWLKSLCPDVIYDCSQNYQHGILTQIAKPSVLLTFSFSTKYAFGLISQNLYAGNDFSDVLAGSEYVLVPCANAFYKYKYKIDGNQITVDHNGTYKTLGLIEAKIIPGYFGERKLLQNKYWEPVIKACLSASELSGVKKRTLYSCITEEEDL